MTDCINKRKNEEENLFTIQSEIARSLSYNQTETNNVNILNNPGLVGWAYLPNNQYSC